MQAGLIAEEHEVSGEVDRIEIASAICEKLVRKTNCPNSRLGAGRQQVAHVTNRAPGIERRDEHAACRDLRKLGDGLRALSQDLTSDRRHVLDEAAGDVELRERIKIGKPIGEAVRS